MATPRNIVIELKQTSKRGAANTHPRRAFASVPRVGTVRIGRAMAWRGYARIVDLQRGNFKVNADRS